MALQGTVQCSKVFLQVSEALPHLSISLGDNIDTESCPVLEEGADTMCRAYMGNLVHHCSIMENHPSLMA
eukprot:7743772-Ditylum_brightwellii.AAC.2